MIIVSGKLDLHPGTMAKFLDASREAIVLARKAPGCHDFVVAADPIEPDRVNVHEEWESEEAMLSFRGEGPDNEMQSNILRANLSKHVVESTGTA